MTTTLAKLLLPGDDRHALGHKRDHGGTGVARMLHQTQAARKRGRQQVRLQVGVQTRSSVTQRPGTGLLLAARVQADVDLPV